MTAEDIRHRRTPWALKTACDVFRLIEARWVEEFFDTGALYLSSFRRFSEHPDEARQDRAEGTALSVLSDGDRTFASFSTMGTSAHVLCGTLDPSPRVRRDFHATGFRIDNPDMFAACVAARLGADCLHGRCTYQETRVLRATLEAGSVDALFRDAQDRDGNVDLLRLHAHAARSADDQMLLKEARYAYQAEYRFLWHAQGEGGGIHIAVPEAREFCSRIRFHD